MLFVDVGCFWGVVVEPSVEGCSVVAAVDTGAGTPNLRNRRCLISSAVSSLPALLIIITIVFSHSSTAAIQDVCSVDVDDGQFMYVLLQVRCTKE